jgi:hypothetical protein
MLNDKKNGMCKEAQSLQDMCFMGIHSMMSYVYQQKLTPVGGKIHLIHSKHVW